MATSPATEVPPGREFRDIPLPQYVSEAIDKHVADHASTALAEGIPITDVSRWLGHKSIEVTHQIYGHLVPANFNRARATLDAAYQASRRKRPRKAVS